MRKSPNSRFGFKIVFLACSPLPQRAFIHLGVVSELTSCSNPQFWSEKRKEDEAIGPKEGSTSRKPCERMCRARRGPTRKGSVPAWKAAWHRCPSQRRRHNTTDRATSQPGGHTETPWEDSLPWPAGPRPLVHVGPYKAPPSPLLSPHLLFLKSRVRRPLVEALWSTSTAAGHSAKEGALSSSLPKPSAGHHPTWHSSSGTRDSWRRDLLPSQMLKTQTSNQNMQTICTINPDFLYQMMVWLHLLKPDLQPHCKNYNKPNMDKTWATRETC